MAVREATEVGVAVGKGVAVGVGWRKGMDWLQDDGNKETPMVINSMYRAMPGEVRCKVLLPFGCRHSSTTQPTLQHLMKGGGIGA